MDGGLCLGNLIKSMKIGNSLRRLTETDLSFAKTLSSP